jgi:hypothetical protein
MGLTNERFPGLAKRIRGLAEQHRELKDEPLHLAIAYDPGRDEHDVFLFELLGNFGGNDVSPDAELFEASFEGSQSFPMKRGQRLHLVLSNPEELRVALERRWKLAEELRGAVKRGDYEVLYEDQVGREALERFR